MVWRVGRNDCGLSHCHVGSSLGTAAGCATPFTPDDDCLHHGGLWLIGHVAKQGLSGREQFGGTIQQYWRWYVPTLALHTILATVTMGLGVYTLSLGLTRLRQGTGIGAAVAGVFRHRFLGKFLVWDFTGTLLTACMVVLMLFRRFPST